MSKSLGPVFSAPTAFIGGIFLIRLFENIRVFASFKFGGPRYRTSITTVAVCHCEAVELAVAQVVISTAVDFLVVGALLQISFLHKVSGGGCHVCVVFNHHIFCAPHITLRLNSRIGDMGALLAFLKSLN